MGIKTCNLLMQKSFNIAISMFFFNLSIYVIILVKNLRNNMVAEWVILSIFIQKTDYVWLTTQLF